ncbi:endonuclease [marine bacterium AO1-C]|nr:endonuclease [marine bacterium AO1-C]
MHSHNYFVYITTNAERQVIYVGMTNDLNIRLTQHYQNRGNPHSFPGKHHCYYLIYWERYQYVLDAIDREKEIKKWRREKKIALIESLNPQWIFLNDEI